MTSTIPLLIVELDNNDKHVVHHILPLKRIIATGGYTEIGRFEGFRAAQRKIQRSKTWFYCHVGQDEIDLYFESVKNVGIAIKDKNYYNNFVKNMPTVHYKDLNSFFKAIGYEWPYKKRKLRKNKK